MKIKVKQGKQGFKKYQINCDIILEQICKLGKRHWFIHILTLHFFHFITINKIWKHFAKFVKLDDSAIDIWSYFFQVIAAISTKERKAEMRNHHPLFLFQFFNSAASFENYIHKQ